MTIDMLDPVRHREAELGLYSWIEGFGALPTDQAVAEGVTAGEVLAFHRRPRTPAGSVYRSREVYGSAGAGGRDLHLYLYARADAGERRPGVVFIHGGGWHELTPFVHIRAACDLARQGYVTATVHYRLSGEARWPAALEDCKCAVRWLRAHAGEIGLDPDRVAVSGNSAGGHLAAMLAVTPGQFDGDGGNPGTPSNVQAAVLVSPAVDVLHPATPGSLRTGLNNLLGQTDDESANAANPPTYLGSGCPPILSLTGSDDEITPLPMVADFHHRLDAAGVRNELVVYPGAGHGFDVYPQGWEDYIQRTHTFLSTTLPGSGGAARKETR